MVPSPHDESGDITYRKATPEDYEDVVAFTEDTWADLDVEATDYLPDVYHEWIDGEDRQTIVADAGDAIAGISQLVMLSEYEAWAQGMRVNPDFRGQGIAVGINDVLFEWGKNRGAVVARNLVFSWNQAGLGHSRAAGFEPVTEFRWLHPEPDSTTDANTAGDPDAAWAFWSGSDVRTHLRGLALDLDQIWALRELTRGMLARAASETALLTVRDENGVEAMSYRSRTFEDAGGETCAEYGVSLWQSVEAGRELLGLIAADAAKCGADRTRVLLPETPQYVTDGAYLRAPFSSEPDFVLAVDLTAHSAE